MLKAFLAADQAGGIAEPTYRDVKGGTEVIYRRAGDDGPASASELCQCRQRTAPRCWS
jgi:hypothetical protein